MLGSVALLTAAAGCRESRPPETLERSDSRSPPPTSTAPASVLDAALVQDAATVEAGPAFPLLSPSPLVSRGKSVFATALAPFAHPSAINDGVYGTFAGTWIAGTPSEAKPARIAISIGSGPRKLLVVWSSGGNFNYTDTEYGSPGSYRIETSADTHDGVDGTWNVAATNTRCTVHAQAHLVDFAGQSWVRMVVTGVPPKLPNGLQLDEIDVHDASDGAMDSWFFFGDSITALTFNRTTPNHQPSFAAVVHEKHPRFFPAMINGGIGGESSDQAAQRVDAWLELNPDMHVWAIAFGTNDAAGNNDDTDRFRRNMASVVTKLLAKGHVPILARIPYSSESGHRNIPKLNRVIDQLTIENRLVPGPDLYGWFQHHPNELRDDGVHPNDAGILSINRLWAEAADRLYEK